MSKERIFTTLALAAAFIQGLLPTLGLSMEYQSISTTILLTLVSVFTILKQRVSVEISKNAVKLTWVLIAIAAFGGLNDLVDFINLTPEWQERLRTVIAGIIGLLNITSKNLFPTDEAKAIEQQKQQFAQTQKFKQ